MKVQQDRPMNFHSNLHSNVPSFKESPSKYFSRTGQQIPHATTPNFYKYDSLAINRTGPINFNISSSLNKEDSLMMNTNPNLANFNKNLKANTQQNFYKSQGSSLFDRYYKQMLFLNECDPSDIQTPVRNPVLYQEELKIQSKIEVNPKDKRFNKTQQFMGKTASNMNEIPIQSKLNPGISRFSPQKTFQNERSDQFVENQILFNHKKIIAQRKAQKQSFLSNIQSKIQALQKQTEQIQKIRAQQRDYLQQIRNLQQGIQSQIGNNKLIGKIDQLLMETMQDGQNKRKLVKKIQQQMEAEQINDIIDEEVKANNDLLEEIEEQLKGRKVQASGTGWWNSKQKSTGGDKIKENGSKMNTAVGGFNKNSRTLNSSAGFGSRMTVKETGVDKNKQNKNMSSTFNKSNSKKIVNTQNQNSNKNRSNSKQKN